MSTRRNRFVNGIKDGGWVVASSVSERKVGETQRTKLRQTGRPAGAPTLRACRLLCAVFSRLFPPVHLVPTSAGVIGKSHPPFCVVRERGTVFSGGYCMHARRSVASAATPQLPGPGSSVFPQPLPLPRRILPYLRTCRRWPGHAVLRP